MGKMKRLRCSMIIRADFSGKAGNGPENGGYRDAKKSEIEANSCNFDADRMLSSGKESKGLTIIFFFVTTDRA